MVKEGHWPAGGPNLSLQCYFLQEPYLNLLTTCSIKSNYFLPLKRLCIALSLCLYLCCTLFLNTLPTAHLVRNQPKRKGQLKYHLLYGDVYNVWALKSSKHLLSICTELCLVSSHLTFSES